MNWLKLFWAAQITRDDRTQEMAMSVVTVLVAWNASVWWAHLIVAVNLLLMCISLYANWSTEGCIPSADSSCGEE